LGNVIAMRVAFALGAVLAVGAAATAPASPAAATTPCWKAAISDWSQDDSVDGRYSSTCLRQAMANAPTDLKIYSSLEDDLRAALRARPVRRLAGLHRTAAASINAPGASSSLSPLAIVLGGLAVLVAACTAGAIVRRRAEH
jgi:hypothetical protein